MKVLIETITSRRGYKNFADEAELDDFLAHNHNKITDYSLREFSFNSGKRRFDLLFLSFRCCSTYPRKPSLRRTG